MKVKYKVIDYKPEVEWIAVEFWDADKPDMEPWIQQFSFPDFTAEKLTEQLMAIASRFAGSWNRISDHSQELSIPQEGTLEVEPELYLPYEINPQYEPEPEFDEWTQELLPGDITSPTQESIPWEIRDLTDEEIEERLRGYEFATRQERNMLLLESDFFNFPDACVANVQDWLDYRQALRDLPEQPGWPKSIIWPERPEVVKEQ